MEENKFLIKFKEKTNSELEYILSNEKKYQEKAVSATMKILSERNNNSEYLENYKKRKESTSIKGKKIKKSLKQTEKINILSPFKWILIILFFPVSLIFVAYYRQKRPKKMLK